MKYLTKEWYELCQRTGLHFGMSVHNGAAVYDEALYLELYKRKEQEFIKSRREVYDVDPRFMLKQDGCTLVPAAKFMNGEGIKEEDKIVHVMPPEEKERIQQLIADYDARPSFDMRQCQEEFPIFQETFRKETSHRLPRELLEQIADMRVFSLGYCTKDILQQLKSLSEENRMTVQRVSNEYSKAQQVEDIPQIIRERFAFHDCLVTAFSVDQDVIMYLDTQGGFTDYNRITFTAAEMIRREEPIIGSTWLYQELYRREKGYEAHMLFGREGMPELIIRCQDIIVEKV
ncbi:DUF4085 family protein [Desulfosporosinus meridiei]|uniref:DUF4085 family protein n=1 Tax=Desulfosporosinus meridiei (strain ATCC BAA-275 / DSM 13257 / KCTC 12902 / NCIMB 13706 / S10) TaxID=768704 RepID=J7IXN7_DESMD|nr:DUF4085 family protein [Desulfosporosinus meridiei]AFQ43863.1 hypothetical protein Desmer_1908 [Desulfosporosinus meridiei DSM 13257]